MKLEEILRILGTAGSDMNALQPVGYSIDSRTMRAGDLFFAIKGENTDGHRFVNEALQKGALAAIVARDFDPGPAAQSVERKLIRVGDTLRALQSLASAVLRSWKGQVVAVTGSSGKTTVKELTASALSSLGRVIKSAGNLNNQYGVPLSVLRMESDGAQAADFDFAVLEMGMNHRGEIADLTAIAPPDVGIVTNVSAVHLEFFASVDEIAEAKSEMVRGIKSGGAAVLNADDERVARMRGLRRDIKVKTFGIDRDADVRATGIRSLGLDGALFTLQTSRGQVEATMPLLGKHNLYNTLAAAAVAEIYEAPLERIAEAIALSARPKMRGEVLRLAEGITLIDDSYNSNPRALQEMVATLSSGPGARRIVVAGEMLELGRAAPDLHFDAGRYIAGQDVQLLIGVRGLARQIVAGAIEAGISPDRAVFCETPEEAGELLVKEARPGDAILVKGSRGVKMERLVDLMKQRFQ
jgi:UDP-N-acetylmuramoyl-tripeptide--D-alanyl-D-alanine ligase